MSKRIVSVLAIIFIFTLPLNSIELTLEQAGELAVEVSPDLRQLGAQIHGATINHKRGIANYFPVISLSGSQNNSIRIESSDSRQLAFNAQITQPIYNGGRTRIGRQLSVIEIDLQRQNLIKQEDALLDQVWELFYGIIIQEEKVELYKKTMEITLQQLKISELQLELGEITELDHLEASLQASSLSLMISEEERSLKQMEFQLKQILQIDPVQEMELIGELPINYEGMTIESTPETLFQVALANNLELDGYEFELTRQRTQLQLSNRTYLPQISLKGNFQLSDNDLPLQNFNYSIGLDISFPFRNFPLTMSIGYSETPGQEFSSYNSQNISSNNDYSHLANDQISELSIEVAQEKIDLFVDSLRSNIFFFIQNLEDQKFSLDLQRQELEILSKRTELMNLQLDLGEIKLLDYLEAEMELAQKKQALLEACLALKKQERELEKLLGLSIGELASEYGF